MPTTMPTIEPADKAPVQPTGFIIHLDSTSKRYHLTAFERNLNSFQGLTKPANTEWARIVAELSALDMLRSVDSSALAAYCQSYARWQSAEKIVDKEGQTVQEPVTKTRVMWRLRGP